MKKLVVISIDAMGALDLTGDLSHVPTLNAFKEQGTHVKAITPIYPSLTYPSHTTIMTGVYPNKHGIINNTKLQPERKSPDWFWYHRDIKVPTFYEIALKQGRTVAAFLWPVTAKSKIQYNIAEIFPNRIWTNQVAISLQASSPYFLFEMNRKFGKLRQGIKQPYLDDFVTACAVDTLENKKPDITLIHLVDMDSMRHAYGVDSVPAKEAFLRQDKRLKQIIEATKRAETYEETTFVVLGDHYQIDVSKMIRLNAAFAERGWLTLGKDKTVTKGWDVYGKSCDGSTYIYCDKNSPVTPREIQELVSELEGIEAIYTTEQAKEFGTADNITLMVEAKRGYYFIDEAQGSIVEEVKASEIGQPERYKAVHGFSPKKENYATTMMVMGAGIHKGKEIERARLIDEAPTFAEIVGLTEFPKNIDGQVITEIFVAKGEN